MKYLKNLMKHWSSQVVLGLIGMGHVFGGPAHISGAVHGHSPSTITHISGAVYLGANSLNVKTHISGSKKALSVQEPKPVQSKVTRKARNTGITLAAPEKSTSTQVKEKSTEKTKTSKGTVKIVGPASLKERIKRRKACWKACENTWKFNIQERCFALSNSLRQDCKKELFQERLSCVSQNCRETAQ